jgi:hypothetical protein
MPERWVRFYVVMLVAAVCLAVALVLGGSLLVGAGGGQ